MSKQVLKLDPDLDFVLVAVTSPLKDYRFCYFINKQLNFDFARIDDLSIAGQQKGSTANFARFYTFWEATETEFYLLANKGTEGLLVPEMRNVDYFILIKNYIDEDELDEIVVKLNQVQDVIAAVKIDPKKVKSSENLLF